MAIYGYIASIFIGISLGLIGGGGSILTVPVLVYLFGIDAVSATLYSLLIVGATSSVGSVSYFRKGLVSLKTALAFGASSVAAVFISRNVLVAAIPEQVVRFGAFVVTKSTLLLLLFAVLMLAASWSMIRKKPQQEAEEPEQKTPSYALLLFMGLFVGLVTGLVGAGGGFLIIPALVQLLRLPMKKAVGTSLVIIALNSLLGFAFSMGRTNIPWVFLSAILGIAILGILIGSALASRVDGKKLKPAFGWFVLVMGIYILIKETLLK